MSTIRIKRSGTSGSPPSLAQGELAYSYLDGTESNGGDRLYIGTGTEISGNAANIEVIGGTYFTSKLDHTPGILVSNSAIVVDSDNKIDVLNIDNIRIDGNEIKTTNTDGNISINPNGSGNIDVSNSRIINVTNPTNSLDAANKDYVDQVTSEAVGNVTTSFTITGDSGSDSFDTGETLTFTGQSAITTAVSNNEISIDLDDTAVTPGSYGTTTEIPTFTVDQQGRLTAAGSVSISTDLNVSGDSGTDTISLASETLVFSGESGITTTVSSNTVSIDLDDTAVTPGSYGSANTVASFAVDQQGRLTSATTVAIDHDALANFVQNEHVDHSNVNISAGNGLSGGGDITTSRSFDVVGGAGITSNTSGVHIETSGDSSLVANTSGLFIDDSTLDIAASQLTSDVALGTQTSGDYVSDISGGTGVTITGGTGEGSSPSVAIGQDVSPAADVTFNDITVNGSLFSNDVTADEVVVTGNLVVQGTTTTINSEEIDLADNIINLNSNLDSGTAPTQNAGISVNRGSSANVSFEWNESLDKWSIGTETIVAGTFEGNLNGNADTAATLETARTITLSGDINGSVSFDGSQNVVIATTVQPDSIALGTDTTGDYVESVGVTAGSGLSITGSGEGAAVTLAGINASTSTKGVASFNANNFTVSSGAVSIAAIDGGTY
jgi:hypothetical protein